MMIYFLVILMSIPVFKGMTTYMSWRINQVYIAKYLCVNREKKELKCNGKCHLMKNLKEQEQQDNTPIPHKIKEIKLDLFICSSVALLYSDKNRVFISKSEISYQNHIKATSYCKIIFTPPDLLV
ncbi:MAG: hypothetical protein WAT46_13960 [Saprospiraceae bacterium]